METVCLALEKDNKLFAVGSQSHVSFYEPRCGTAVGYIGSRDPGAGESWGGGGGAEGQKDLFDATCQKTNSSLFFKTEEFFSFIHVRHHTTV